MGRISIRLSLNEENILKNEAIDAGTTVTEAVRSRLFHPVDESSFESFKTDQIKVNEQITELLLSLVQHTRIAENMSYKLFRYTNAKAANEALEETLQDLDNSQKGDEKK